MTVWFENINLYQMLKSTNIISHFLLKTSVIVYYKNHVQLHYLFTEFMVNSIMQIINEFWFANPVLVCNVDCGREFISIMDLCRSDVHSLTGFSIHLDWWPFNWTVLIVVHFDFKACVLEWLPPPATTKDRRIVCHNE